MATSEGAVLKELHKLMRSVGKLTTGQAKIEIDCEELGLEAGIETTFLLSITPNDGHYRGATCKFKVVIPSSYPDDPPTVTCLNRIYHPNIDINEDDEYGASICVNLLDSDWEPGVGLDGCVMAILFLFYNPNVEDALSPVFSGSDFDEEEFEMNVRASLRGEMVEDMVFDKLLNDEEDDNSVKLTDNIAPADSNIDKRESRVGEAVSQIVNVDDANANNSSQNVTVTGSDESEDNVIIDDFDDISKKNRDRNEDANISDDKRTTEIICNNSISTSTKDTTGDQLEQTGDNSQTLVEKEADAEHGNNEKSTDCACKILEKGDIVSSSINTAKQDTGDTDHKENSDHDRGACVSNIHDQVGAKDNTVQGAFIEQMTSLGSKVVPAENHNEGNSSTLRAPVMKDRDDLHRCSELQTIDAACLDVATKGRNPIIWHKTLSIFGRLYRWLKGCTRRQSCDIYVVNRADLKHR